MLWALVPNTRAAKGEGHVLGPGAPCAVSRGVHLACAPTQAALHPCACRQVLGPVQNRLPRGAAAGVRGGRGCCLTQGRAWRTSAQPSSPCAPLVHARAAPPTPHASNPRARALLPARAPQALQDDALSVRGLLTTRFESSGAIHAQVNHPSVLEHSITLRTFFTQKTLSIPALFSTRSCWRAWARRAWGSRGAAAAACLSSTPQPCTPAPSTQ